MRVLNFFLSLMLVAILFWGMVVGFGPKILIYVFQKNFGEQIRFSDLKISPKFALTSRQIDLNIKLPQSEKRILGNVRAGVLNWSVSDFKPKLQLSLGPTSINNFGELESLEIKFIWDSWALWTTPRLVADFDRVIFSKVVNLDHLRLNGYFSNSLSNLKDLTFDASWSNRQNILGPSSGVLKGQLDQINIKRPLLEQDNKLSLEFNELSLHESDFRFKSPKFSLDNERGKILVSALIEILEFTQNGDAFDNFQLTGSYFLDEGDWGYPIEISITEGVLGALQLGASNLYFEEINRVPHLKFMGDVTSIDLSLEGQYFGRINSGEMVADLRFPTVGQKIMASGSTKLKVFSDPKVLMEVTAAADIAQNKILKCLDQECPLNEVSFEYSIGVSNESLTGSSFCVSTACSKYLFENKILLNDTPSFFAELGKTNIFSPLALSYLYIQVASGEAKGTGHVYEF